MSLYGLHEWDPKTWMPEKGERLLREAQREALWPWAVVGMAGGLGCLIIVFMKLIWG